MKNRYLEVENGRARSLPDRLKDEATHTLNITNAQYDLSGCGDYFVVEDGQPRVPTQEELDERYAVAQSQADYNLIEQIWRACRAYQDTQLTDDISTMYYIEKGVSTKAQACIDWKNTLWTDYYTRKALLSEDFNFSNNGSVPYSYPEVKAEVEAI